MCRRKSQDGGRSHGAQYGTTPPKSSSSIAATTSCTTVATTTLTSGCKSPSRSSHGWSVDKQLSINLEQEKKTTDQHCTPTPRGSPSSTPRRERRFTSSDNDNDLKNTPVVQPPPELRLQHYHGHSVEDVRRASNSSRTQLDQPIIKTSVLTSTSVSASESSPEEGDHGAIRQRDHSTGRSCRRSYRQQPRDQSIYLSADDACFSRWHQQRRYSSESSDASESSSVPIVHRSRHNSNAALEDAAAGSGSSPLLHSNRRRLFFRSSRSRHFFDGDGSDGYDADEQSGRSLSFFFLCLFNLIYSSSISKHFKQTKTSRF